MIHRFLLLLMLCGLFAAGARAATVSGTITNASTSLPVTGQKVLIMDSLVSYVDSAFTNSSGAYSFTLPASVTTGHPLLIYGFACGAYFSAFRTYAGSIGGLNFSVCASATTYMLHGTISLSGANNGQAQVYLIRKSYDSAIADTVLRAIDSMTTAPSGGTYSKTYSAVPTGTLLLKAALLPSHPQYSNYIPTYYTSSMIWSGATPLSAANFNSATATNISMTAGTNPGGSGFIGGSVVVGANKTAAVGDPLASRIIILTTGSNVPVAYTYSSSLGRFSFSNIAYGTYKLFGDAWGKTNPALTVTITPTQGSINNILFQENNKLFWGRIGGLGVTANSLLAGISTYPNPASDYLEVGGLDAVPGAKTLTLTAVNGTVVARQELSPGAAARLSTVALSPGLYVLRVQTAEGTVQIKVTK